MAEKLKDPQLRELSDPPFDSISSLSFSPTNPSSLLAASWDTTLYYYDTIANERRCKFDHRAAVLDCCFSSDGKHAFSGGLDTSVRETENIQVVSTLGSFRAVFGGSLWFSANDAPYRRFAEPTVYVQLTEEFDLETEKVRHLGQHDNAVSRTTYASQINALVSGSWDRTLRLWDPRSAQAQVGSYPLPERVYNMDIAGSAGNTLVVGMASRLFHIYDVRKMDGGPAQERESSLKFLTRAMGCMVDGQGYAVGSVEGRIAVEYFDPSPEAQEKKYAFKCHRQSVNGEDHVWPVNCIAFHPIYNTFASAGSDGSVSIWDHKSKKRLRQYPHFNQAVPAVAWSCDGRQLAVAESYNWDEGREGASNVPPPRLLIRDIGDEVKPKGWTG